MRRPDVSVNRFLLRDLLSLLNSVVRTAATLMIFAFHVSGLHGVSLNGMVFAAFVMFMFLSGFYSLLVGDNPTVWLLRRLRRIFIPYWLVMIGVIAANSVFHYKKVGLLEVVVLLLGGNMFISHKLYVIAWFVSLILCFYVATYLVHMVPGVVPRILCAGLLVLAMLRISIPFEFITAFVAGLALRHVVTRSGAGATVLRAQGAGLHRLRRTMLAMQNYSYEFFLLHGGILLFFSRTLGLDKFSTVVLAFMTTVLCSVVLRWVSNSMDWVLSRPFAWQEV